MHYNAGPVDFKPNGHSDELEHIDIESSYASFWKCASYECFPDKLTDLRVTDKIEGSGFYLIDELDWSGADAKFTEICERLGAPYENSTLMCTPTQTSHFCVAWECTLRS